MSKTPSQKITYKMILIGDSSVGKTCIFKKITSGAFNDKSISTIGIDRRTLLFKVKVNDNEERECEVQLWDTAGQERFRSITTSYYKSSQGLILMYDITKKETFDNLDNWISSINDSLGESKGYLVVLIGNKLDIAEDTPDARQVTLEEAKNKCSEEHIFWGGECSAKNFTEEQLKELFTTFTQEIYKKVGACVAREGGQVVGKKKSEKKKCC